ncbi:MAG TPA: rod shape-determining protein MreD [Acidimicrobiales bacterium]|nr:rod shape-determining protein MreD [Acidimicrobiales bacterium]
MSASEAGVLDGADVARISVVLVVVLVVQHTLLDSVRFGGAHPELVFMAAAAAGYVGGPERGAGVGFAMGLLADLLLPTTFGLTALVCCLVGFTSAFATGSLVRGSRWIALVTLTVATVAGLVGYAVLAALLGQSGALAVQLPPALVVATPAAAILAVPMYGLVRWAVPPAVPPAATASPGAIGR